MTARSNAARVRKSKQAMATSEQILKSFVERIDSPEDDRQFDYLDPATERLFMVFRSEGYDQGDEIFTRYCLKESTPGGRVAFWNDQGFCTGSQEEPRLVEAEKRVGPNGFAAEVRRLGFDPDTVPRFTGGYSVTTIYLRSMDECAQAIERCLHENVRYNSERVLTEQEKTRLERRWSASSFEHHKVEAAVVAQTWATEPELFKGCHTGLHTPLAEETKKDILAYLNAPSYDAWVEVRSLMVVGSTTLWNAWCKFDSSAPRVGDDKRFPAPDILRQAIRQAAESHRDAVAEKQKTTTRSGLKLV